MNIHLYSEGEIRCFQEFKKIIVQVFKSVLSLKLIAQGLFISMYDRIDYKKKKKTYSPFFLDIGVSLA